MTYDAWTPDWKIDEDSGVSVVDQIKRKVNCDANLEWCRKKNEQIMPKSALREYLKETGRKFLRTCN